MLVVAIALAAAACGATGTFLTKGLSIRMPAWQVVGPLFAINAALVLPFVPFGSAWHTFEASIPVIHLASIAVLCGSTACMFALITRGRASGVAVGQALSPAATLLAAPILLGVAVTPLAVLGASALMVGSLIPLRRSFDGIGSLAVMMLLLCMGLCNGMVGVLTAMLAARDVGLAETYVVRTSIAAVIFLSIFPPRALRGRDLGPLAIRAGFVTASFVLTILAIQRGSVVVIQSILATIPLMVVALEWMRHRSRPDPGIVLGSTDCSSGPGTTVAGRLLVMRARPVARPAAGRRRSAIRARPR